LAAEGLPKAYVAASVPLLKTVSDDIDQEKKSDLRVAKVNSVI
jgi:hypothetical protein